jgi:hypothetical protein
MVSRDAIQERAGRPFFFIEFPGLANQCKKGLLYDVGRGVRTSRHVHRVPIYATLVPAVKLQECAFVANTETPHEFDIPWFGYVWHLPRLDVCPAYGVTLKFLANGWKVPISSHSLVRGIPMGNRGLTPLALVRYNL